MNKAFSLCLTTILCENHITEEQEQSIYKFCTTFKYERHNFLVTKEKKIIVNKYVLSCL